MEHYINKTDIKKYLILPKSFDWDLIDQEQGFSKIFKFIPLDIYNLLKREPTSEDKIEIYRLLTKASAHYSFAFSIPKLKVHIANYGIQEFSQDKVKSAAWWDVRDLGLSIIKIADKCFSEALSKIFLIEELKSELDFFKEERIISTPEEFENIYSIGNSPEVFLMMDKFIKQGLEINVKDKLSSECITNILESDVLSQFLKDAIVFYSLYYASLLPTFVFMHNSIAISYEELPWQKSKILTLEERARSGENFKQLGEENMKIIIRHIKQNLSQFPCYVQPVPEMVAKARDSGISLLG